MNSLEFFFNQKWSSSLLSVILKSEHNSFDIYFWFTLNINFFESEESFFNKYYGRSLDASYIQKHIRENCSFICYPLIIDSIKSLNMPE